MKYTNNNNNNNTLLISLLLLFDAVFSFEFISSGWYQFEVFAVAFGFEDLTFEVNDTGILLEVNESLFIQSEMLSFGLGYWLCETTNLFREVLHSFRSLLFACLNPSYFDSVNSRGRGCIKIRLSRLDYVLFM